MTVNELDSRVAVVHRCFSERGDSILSVFRCKRNERAKRAHSLYIIIIILLMT